MSITVLIDRSGSMNMRGAFEETIHGVCAMLTHAQKGLHDGVRVVVDITVFNNLATPVCQQVQLDGLDVAALGILLAGISCVGGTALHDSVCGAIRAHAMQPSSGPSMFILATDGDDTASSRETGSTMRAAWDAMERKGCVCTVLGLGGMGVERLRQITGTQEMSALSVGPGGMSAAAAVVAARLQRHVSGESTLPFTTLERARSAGATVAPRPPPHEPLPLPLRMPLPPVLRRSETIYA
jgi:hypothetical protein